MRDATKEVMNAFATVARQALEHVFPPPAFEDAAKDLIAIAHHLQALDVELREQPTHAGRHGFGAWSQAGHGLTIGDAVASRDRRADRWPQRNTYRYPSFPGT